MRSHNDFDRVHNNEYAITVAESGQTAACVLLNQLRQIRSFNMTSIRKDDIRIHAIPDQLLNSLIIGWHTYVVADNHALPLLVSLLACYPTTG